MITVGFIVVALAALLHVYIFYLESVIWTSEKARATFGTTESEALATKALAFNQGFYNLFLAVLIIAGAILYFSGYNTAGSTLALAGAGSMTAAALVLLLSSPDKRAAALKQGVIPAIGIVLLVIGLAM